MLCVEGALDAGHACIGQPKCSRLCSFLQQLIGYLCCGHRHVELRSCIHTCFSGLLLQVSEAEAMVAGGVADVFVSNEVVAAPKLQRLVALSAQGQYGAALWTGRRQQQ